MRLARRAIRRLHSAQRGDRALRWVSGVVLLALTASAGVASAEAASTEAPGAGDSVTNSRDAGSVPMFDSGWAIAEPKPPGEGSVLGTGRADVRPLLPPKALDGFVVPNKPSPAGKKPSAPKPQAAGPGKRPAVASQPGGAKRIEQPGDAAPASPAKPIRDIAEAFALPGRSVPSSPPEDAAGMPAAAKTSPREPRASASTTPAPKTLSPRALAPKTLASKRAAPPANPEPASPSQTAPRPSESGRVEQSAGGPVREPAPFPALEAEPDWQAVEQKSLADDTPAPAKPAPLPQTTEAKPDAPRVAEKPKRLGTGEKESSGKLSDAEPAPTPPNADSPEDAAEKSGTPVATTPKAPLNTAPEPSGDAALEMEEAEADEPTRVAARPMRDTPAPEPKLLDPPETATPRQEADDESPENEAREPQREAYEPVRLPPPAIGIAGVMKPAAGAPAKPLTRSQQYLRRRLRSVLAYYYRRPLNNRDHDPWEVMHGMLAYGLHSRILDTTARSKPVTAIGYLCFNKPCKRKRLMHLTPEGQIDADVAYGVQGHRGQFLAMLAQCNVSPDYPVRIADKEFTIHDLIEYEKRTCYDDIELTFKLLGLAHYLDLDETWVSDDGQEWSFPRLIEIERNSKIRGAPCGGTHRLSGIALAARLRDARGQSLSGEYLEALRFTEQQQAYAFRLQNRDGSLSTEWFRGPGAEEDINRRARTTGHLLEWLLYSLPEERLTESRTVRAVNYLTSLLASNTDNAWEIGPLSHALHALMLYDERVFQPHDNRAAAGANGAGRGAGSSKSGSAKSNPATKLSYQNINSRVYGTYLSAEAAEEARDEAASPGGLRSLFGIGSTRARRSR